ncbi:hypothetical protein DL96DRAFT_1799234 [Flagelloscypha sp. PMI_526]|nr:hypothetical protein DL96DRAFT_1799234 [Flagelloscypha sp. PMI_526]
MASFIYVDTPNNNLICCICRLPFTDPVTTTCSHTFCKDCIHSALSHSSLCPIDRSPLDPLTFVSADPIIRSLVDELLVECVYSSAGCKHTCERASLASHLKDNCGYVLVDCPAGSCSARFRRLDVDAHRCKGDGDELNVCSRCGASVAMDDIENHNSICSRPSTSTSIQCPHCNDSIPHRYTDLHRDSCPSFPVKCLQSLNGCPWTGPRSSLDEHTSLCAYEAIKGFFALNASLKEDNIVLRAKVEALEKTVASMRKEMVQTKHVLGPWIGPASQAQHAPSSPVPPSGQPTALSPSVDGEHHPPPEPVGSSPQRLIGHRTSSSLNLDHYTSSSSSSTVPPSLPLIPPIPDTTSNATLSGTLTSLHRSITSLASSFDAMNRRNELTLANETMRLNDDVMSMRGAIHGLRLQLHGIMMERGAGSMAWPANASAPGNTPDDVGMAPQSPSAWPGFGMGIGMGMPRPPFFPPTMGGPSITKL